MKLLSPRTFTRQQLPRAVVWIGAIGACLVAIAVARTALGVTRGLAGDYFDPSVSERVPTIAQVDTGISTDQVDRAWLWQAPPVFSVRWVGFLMVPRAGNYTFATTSDDGSTLSIDGRVVVDNSGRHGAVTRNARIDLAEGPHLLVLEFHQEGGAFAIELSWANDGGALEAVPSWLLTTGRTRYWKLVVARVLDALWAAAWIAAAVATAASLARHRRTIVAEVQRRPRLATLGLFVALAVLETWPLASNPAHLSRNDNGDAMLNEWTIAWVVHQVTRAPWDLYDANIFYPDRNSLSYSEAMIVQSAFAAPVLWLGGSAVLAYNLVLLAGFALSGWTMALVMARWTGDWAAGLVAGVVFAFNGHTLTRIPQLQAHHVEFLPLALFALDALLTKPRLRGALALAGWFVLQAMASVYLMVFTAVALGAATLTRPEDWIGGRFKGMARYLMAAAAVAGVLLIPYLLPYWRLRYQAGLARPIEEVAFYGASWTAYLGTPSRLHFPTWSHLWFTGNALFPGVVGLAFAFAALYLRGPWRDRRVRMCLAFGVCGVALSFGPALPGYALMYRFVPALQGIRVASRFGYLGIVAVALLAGMGFAAVRQRMSGARRTLLAAFVVPLAVVETLAIPLGLTVFRRIPPFYEQLRDDPEAVIVELPLPVPPHLFGNARYMLASTVHWRPLVNGYSGLTPPSYHEHVRLMQGFPAPPALAALQTEGVTRVIVHADAVAPSLITQMESTPQLRRVAADGPFLLYRLDRPSNREAH